MDIDDPSSRDRSPIKFPPRAAIAAAVMALAVAVAQRPSLHAAPGAVLWTYEAGARLSGAPSIAEDGTAYVGALDGLLHAVDHAGTQRWVFVYTEHGRAGAQAFHGAPALGEDGTIYIGDDIVVPNYFFAVHPDGRSRWTYETWGGYSQIDTSPALDRRGRFYAGMHGWGAGVDYGSLLVLIDGGFRIGSTEDTGPILASPAVLDDDRVVFAAPVHQEWVLPSPTPEGQEETPTPIASATVTPAATPTSAPTRTPRIGTPLPVRGFLPYARTDPLPATASSGQGRGSESTRSGTDGSAGATPAPNDDAASDSPVESPGRADPANGAARFEPGARGEPPYSLRTPVSPGRGRPLLSPSGALASQPRPSPWVTVPVPARLHVIGDDPLDVRVHDLDGMDGPGSLAADGTTIWFGVTAPRAALVSYVVEPDVAARLVRFVPLTAPVAGSPILGRRDGGSLTVIALQTNGTLTVLDVPDDEAMPVRERWSRVLGAAAAGAPALGADGLLYAGVDGWVLALHRADGAIAWRSAPIGGLVTTAISLAPDGRVIAGSDTGRLVAIEGAEGGLDPQAVWPSYRHDVRNTGAAPLRVATEDP